MTNEEILERTYALIAVDKATAEFEEALVKGTAQESDRERIVEAKTQEGIAEIKKGVDKVVEQSKALGTIVQKHVSLLPAATQQEFLEAVKKFDALDQKTLEKRYQECETLQEVIGISEEVFRELYRYGVSLFDQGDHIGAGAFFEFLASMNPSYTSVWHASGLNYMRRELYPDAAVAFAVAIGIDEEAVTSRLCLLEALLELGETEEAKRQLAVLEKRDDLLAWQEFLQRTKNRLYQETV